MAEDFLLSLQNNPNLRNLSFLPYYDQYNFEVGMFGYDGNLNLKRRLEELLQSNKCLQSVEVVCNSYHNLTESPEILELMHHNRAIINARIQQAFVLMKMAALRPNFLGAHLPLEVWKIIFSFFDLTRMDVQAEALFSKIVRSFNNAQ